MTNIHNKTLVCLKKIAEDINYSNILHPESDLSQDFINELSKFLNLTPTTRHTFIEEVSQKAISIDHILRKKQISIPEKSLMPRSPADRLKTLSKILDNIIHALEKTTGTLARDQPWDPIHNEADKKMEEQLGLNFLTLDDMIRSEDTMGTSVFEEYLKSTTMALIAAWRLIPFGAYEGSELKKEAEEAGIRPSVTPFEMKPTPHNVRS